MAMTRRQSHLLTMSEVTPTPDLQARMSGIVLLSSGVLSGPDMPGAPAIRGVLTHFRLSKRHVEPG